ncbi:hypothetical protein V8D89_009330 [Ganoderma adspersum]
MRLLDTETCQFVDKDPEKTTYAILSHTWDKEGDSEQTYEQLRNIQQRYAPASQTMQNHRPGRPEGGASSSRSTKRNRDGTPRTSSSSQLPTQSDRDSALTTTLPRPPISLGRLTQSEVEALFRTFVEWYELASPGPSTPGPASAVSVIWDDPKLSPKIKDACAVARKNGYRYIWIDSCCIDKSSSSELSEAINSMYKWYSLAAVCYAYLADVPPGEDHRAKRSHFRRSRWFTRGWTLQELIAPISVEFLSKTWVPIGSKHALVELVESVTKINLKALLHVEPLDAFSVAQRLSWAARRETTREEDRAYSLLGIFDINMPTLYGEGSHAFRRLQEQIMQRIPDPSLFMWGDLYLASQLVTIDRDWQAQPEDDPPPNLFAMSPDSFQNCDSIRTPHRHAIQLTSSHCREMIEYTSTPYGTRTQFWMIPLTRGLLLRAIQQGRSGEVQLGFSEPLKGSQWYLTILGCEHSEYPGHLLGRVCYIAPSESGVDFVHPGYIKGLTLRHRGNYMYSPDLFPLSPHTIRHYRRHIELRTVYIPHPDRTTLPGLSRLRHQPHAAIKLLLLRETHDALRSRGYSADLRRRDPDSDPAHPTTSHCLTLSKDEHTITANFRHTAHTLGNGSGGRLSIDAEVKMSDSSSESGARRRGVLRVDSTPTNSDPSQEDPSRRALRWSDKTPWETKLDHQRVRLSAAGAGTLTVDFGLHFAGAGVYILHVDVLSDASPAESSLAAVELAVGQAGSEGERIEVCSLSEAADTDSAEEAETASGWSDSEETSGCDSTASVEARDSDVAAAGPGGNTYWQGGDGYGVLARWLPASALQYLG